MPSPWLALTRGVSFNFQIGFIERRGVDALLPATLLLAWALASAYICAAGPRGRRILVPALGDAALAANLVVFAFRNA